MLFNDDSYDKEGGIVFNWNPLFWGMGPESYCYTRSTLQDAILKEMEREHWMGVCCEPNMIFIVCNQFPVSICMVSIFSIKLIRFEDHRHKIQRH
jgi:hypothetical protein